MSDFLTLRLLTISVSVDSPLYVYPHSKTVLNRAIEKDSEFLANNFVMDYSLLVGIDEGKKELVIGIIGKARQEILCLQPTVRGKL